MNTDSAADWVRNSVGMTARPIKPDARRRGQGNHGQDHGDDARFLDLVGVADGHEADEHLGHAEVAEAPGQAAHDGDDAVGAGRAEHRLVALDELVARLIEQRRGDLGAREEAGDAAGRRRCFRAGRRDEPMNTVASAKNMSMP